jgi:mannose-6-phosphate isomerase-like protein (cupin superfamily)
VSAADQPRQFVPSGDPRQDREMTPDDTGERPWGSYYVLDDAEGHKVKRIVVDPGKRLSYQRHALRAEHWFIVHGEAVVTLEGEEIHLCAGAAIDIPRGAAHRIENRGPGTLVFVEVQHGDYFGEDDIVRLADDFGRD